MQIRYNAQNMYVYLSISSMLLCNFPFLEMQWDKKYNICLWNVMESLYYENMAALTHYVYSRFLLFKFESIAWWTK